MAEDTKDTEKAPKDTMHAGAQAAPAGVDLTSNAATRALREQGIIKDPPGPAGVEGEQSTITVGEFDPEPGSTLVTDIPAVEEPEEAEPLNPGNPAPEQVAKQPGETDEAAKERAAAAKKEPAKAGSK